MTFCVVSMELMLKSLSSSHAPYLLHFLHSGVRSSTFLASPLLSGNLGSCVMLLKKIKYIPSWVKNIHLFKDWVFYKSWRAANFHDFSLSVKSTGQSLIEGRVGVVQDSGTRVQGDTLREGAQPLQINARGADIISNLYSQQLVTSGSIFQKYLGYFRYLYIVVIGGPVIVFVVLCARPILGVWRVCGEEDGVGRVARAADYRVSPEPGKWKYNNKIICISTYVLVKLTRFWLWDSLKCVCWKIFILNYI